jgi:ubiquinone biosynthesis protein
MNIHTLPKLSRGAQRVGTVVGVLAKYGLSDWLSHTEFERVKKVFTSQEGELLTGFTRAARIRMALTELGTTYIKFGQMLSTRPDLVGHEVAEELAKLQQGVPPDPPEVVLATVAAELGHTVKELFADFDPTPIGSASIGQVHGARLLDGRRVVVKVQHPGIEARVRGDLEIVQVLAELAEKSAEMKRYQPVALVEVFRRSLLREMDFGREERNLQQFAMNFAGDETVHFPKTFPELSTSRVLTMERLDGASLRDSEAITKTGLERKELARRGAVIWMEMLFRDGFFHADPHPGNLLILPGGVIGILDCGMVDRLDEELVEAIEEALIAIANKDPARVARVIMRLCAAPRNFNEAAFASDLADFVAFYGNQSIDHFQLGKALKEVAQIISRYELILPSTVSRLIKMLAMLEGTARLLNPSVNLIELIKPYQSKLIMHRLSPKRQFRKWQAILSEWAQIGKGFPRMMGDILQQLQTGKFDINLQHHGLGHSVNRLVMGMMTCALFLGSSVLWSNKVPPTIAGYSVCGVLGCTMSMMLGLRLVWKIWRDKDKF